MKVLVTGATGFVGSAFIARTVSDPGFSLRAVLRANSQCLPSGIDTVFVKGLDVATDWREAVRGCDAVVHAAARVHVMQDSAIDPLLEFRRVNVEGTLSLARQAAEAGVKRFVFISSIKVNGDETSPGRSYTSDDHPAPVDPYGTSKHEAEKGLLRVMDETGLEVVIVRPPLVYGLGVKANFLKLLGLARKGIPLPLGSVQNRRSMVYVGNLVSAIMLCIKHPKAAGETFLISDGEDLSTAQLVREMACAMERKVTLLPIPLVALRLIGSLIGKRAEVDRLTGSLCVDSGKIREILDWQPPYTLKQGIQETVDWYLEHG